MLMVRSRDQMRCKPSILRLQLTKHPSAVHAMAVTIVSCGSSLAATQPCTPLFSASTLQMMTSPSVPPEAAHFAPGSTARQETSATCSTSSTCSVNWQLDPESSTCQTLIVLSHLRADDFKDDVKRHADELWVGVHVRCRYKRLSLETEQRYGVVMRVDFVDQPTALHAVEVYVIVPRTNHDHLPSVHFRFWFRLFEQNRDQRSLWGDAPDHLPQGSMMPAGASQ